jgi:type II secretory pathway pseudopilin PulG
MAPSILNGEPQSMSRKHNIVGFTFIGLLIIIAISGIALAGVGIVWHQNQQREREKELLYIGQQYSKAITSYYSGDTNNKQYPKSLEDLVKDKRATSTMPHHIRKLYADPMTHGKPWGLIKQQDSIIGIYSTSREEPIKKTQFPKSLESFAKANTYSDWKFMSEVNNAKSK